MNSSILCNCDVEAESNFLLESLAACKGSETKTHLEMHFTIDLAFMNYFDDFIEELGIPVSRNWTTHEQILSLSIKTQFTQCSKLFTRFGNSIPKQKENLR